MKKIISIFAVVACLITSLFCLTACGGGGGGGTTGVGAGNKIEGTYYLISVTENDVPADIEGYEYSIELKADGTLVSSAPPYDGTWVKNEDGTYTIVFGDPATATLNNGVLTVTVTYEEEVMVQVFQKIVPNSNVKAFGTYQFESYEKQISGTGSNDRINYEVGDVVPGTEETVTAEFLTVELKSWGEVVFTTNSNNMVLKAGTGTWTVNSNDGTHFTMVFNINGKQLAVNWRTANDGYFGFEALQIDWPNGREFHGFVCRKVVA